MYHKILVTLDGTPTDRGIIDHVKTLAQVMHSQIVPRAVIAQAAAATKIAVSMASVISSPYFSGQHAKRTSPKAPRVELSG